MMNRNPKPERTRRVWSSGRRGSMRRLLLPVSLATVSLACGGRDPFWDLPVNGVVESALRDAVAIVDAPAHRVVLLTTDAGRQVYRTEVPIQRGTRTVRVAPDRSKLFIVSEGDGDARPPEGAAPQGPALEIVTRGAAQPTVYPLSEPLGGLALDPLGQWAVLYADEQSSSLVRNPNELLLVDLSRPPASGNTPNPLPHTLRSFGGRPQRFTFTDALSLPGGMRRLLLVETEQDVAVVDLSRPSDPEITIQLTSGQSATRPRPAGIAVSDGDAGPEDARVAIRLESDPTVVIAQLTPGTGRDYSVTLNLVDVGGRCSDAQFVRTDNGALALAALVPSRSKAVLIDPATNLAQDVALPAPYSQLSLVTAQVDGAGARTSTVDVALLWNGGGGGVAFWELGRTAGRPYRSVETVGITAAVTSVSDVGGMHPALKVLQTKESAFFLLDLQSRTSSPFLTASPNVTIQPSIGGDRAWAHVPGTDQLSMIDVATLHPERMRVDRPVARLLEIVAVEGTAGAGAQDGATGARSLVAVHREGGWGATIYDARAVERIDDRNTVSGILLERRNGR